MPAVFTDESPNSYDLIIANQTGIEFTTTLPNGDKIASNPNANGIDFNLAKKAIGNPFLTGLDYRTHAIGAAIMFMNPSTIPAATRAMWFGIRNGVTNQYFWRLYAHSSYAGSNEPRLAFEYHRTDGTLQSNVIYNPGFGNALGSGTTSVWFIELAVTGVYGITLTIRSVNAGGESIPVAYSMAPIIYNVRAPDANEEFVMSIPGGAAGVGYVGKYALKDSPFTFAERQALALAMFAV